MKRIVGQAIMINNNIYTHHKYKTTQLGYRPDNNRTYNSP